MGLLVVNVIILIAGAALLGIAGAFGSNAAVKVSEIPNYTQNNDLNSAHTYLKTGALIAWITVGVLIVTGILLLIFGSRPGAWKWVITVMLFLTAVAAIVAGALFVVAAGNIDNSPLLANAEVNPATNARIGGWMAIGAGILVLILAILVIVIREKSTKQKDLDKQRSKLAAQRAKNRNEEIVAAQKLRIAKASEIEAARNKTKLESLRAAADVAKVRADVAEAVSQEII